MALKFSRLNSGRLLQKQIKLCQDQSTPLQKEQEEKK